jgi:hypothetical protein
LIAWNSGWTRKISALRPAAAAVPWTKLEFATPSEVHIPRRRPPISVFLVTTAKSGPGMTMSTMANARNSPYRDKDMFKPVPNPAATTPVRGGRTC